MARGLALYLGGSYALLEITDIFTDQFGLPDWFFPGALVLLLMGLPIVITTALVQGRAARRHEAEAAVQPASAAGAPEPEGAAAVQVAAVPAATPWLTWHKAMLGLVVTFAVWGMVVSGYMAMRAFGIGPVGSLVAAGVLDERERVIVADFENNTNDPLLGEATTEAFRIDLSQSTIVTVVDPAYVAQVLTRMQRTSGEELGVDLAREVAIREGIKAVVTGEITPVGTGFVMSAQLVAAEDGQVLAARRETANDSTQIIGAIDRLSKKLRERIGESMKTIRANEPLDRMTTPSLEALRKYTQAERAIDQGDNERAIELLEEAVALDTAFAMAYRKLGITLSNIGQDPARAREALTEAYEHRDRLTERERYLTLGSYYNGVTGEEEKAVAAYQSLLDIHPDDPWALNNLAIIYLEKRDYRQAEQLFTHAIRIDSASALYYGNAMSTQVALGKYGDAEYTLGRLAELAPGHPSVGMQATALASSRFDYETAERHVRAFREEQRASPLMQLYASFSLAQIAEVRGQLQEAEGYVLEAIAAAEEQGNNGMYMAGSVRIAFYDLWFRGDADAAVRRVEAALARHPLETIEPLERPYALLATFYALAGRTQRAEAYLAELERATDPILHEADGGPGVARGLVAMMDGRPEEGIAELRAADEGACSICILPVLGQAYDAAGEADSVIAVYERYVNTPWLDRLTAADWFALAGVYERLGGLYELRGDTEKAVLYYSRFVELWKDADPDLQVRVEAARRSIERLSGEI